MKGRLKPNMASGHSIRSWAGQVLFRLTFKSISFEVRTNLFDRVSSNFVQVKKIILTLKQTKKVRGLPGSYSQEGSIYVNQIFTLNFYCQNKLLTEKSCMSGLLYKWRFSRWMRHHECFMTAWKLGFRLFQATQGSWYMNIFVISCHFVMFVDIFFKNRSIDFNQNHSECKT